MCVDTEDNELETLEIIHHYVEILDRYFGNVSPLCLHNKYTCDSKL
jgi:AP-1 complex subunit sigma 1/2